MRDAARRALGQDVPHVARLAAAWVVAQQVEAVASELPRPARNQRRVGVGRCAAGRGWIIRKSASVPARTSASAASRASSARRRSLASSAVESSSWSSIAHAAHARRRHDGPALDARRAGPGADGVDVVAVAGGERTKWKTCSWTFRSLSRAVSGPPLILCQMTSLRSTRPTSSTSRIAVRQGTPTRHLSRYESPRLSQNDPAGARMRRISCAWATSAST
jgi:hypothetical protein